MTCETLSVSFWGFIGALIVERTKQLPEPDTVLQFIEQHKANRWGGWGELSSVLTGGEGYHVC